MMRHVRGLPFLQRTNYWFGVFGAALLASVILGAYGFFQSIAPSGLGDACQAHGLTFDYDLWADPRSHPSTRLFPFGIQCSADANTVSGWVNVAFVASVACVVLSVICLIAADIVDRVNRAGLRD